MLFNSQTFNDTSSDSFGIRARVQAAKKVSLYSLKGASPAGHVLMQFQDRVESAQLLQDPNLSVFCGQLSTSDAADAYVPVRRQLSVRIRSNF